MFKRYKGDSKFKNVNYCPDEKFSHGLSEFLLVRERATDDDHKCALDGRQTDRVSVI